MGRHYQESTPSRDRKCPECGYYFTPQGLSGHIRFAHSSSRSDGPITKSIQHLYAKKIMVSLGEKAFSATPENVQENAQWLDDWERIIKRAAQLSVAFTEDDYKNFVLSRILGENTKNNDI